MVKCCSLLLQRAGLDLIGLNYRRKDFGWIWETFQWWEQVEKWGGGGSPLLQVYKLLNDSIHQGPPLPIRTNLHPAIIIQGPFSCASFRRGLENPPWAWWGQHWMALVVPELSRKISILGGHGIVSRKSSLDATCANAEHVWNSLSIPLASEGLNQAEQCVGI